MFSQNRSVLFTLALSLLLAVTQSVSAQSVHPAIVEYHGKAEGKFAVTNNTSSVMTVVFEPKSFSISTDGHGIFRTLDPGIQVSLSTMSVRLEPLQTYWVFYKALSETYPAWFTVYSTFVPARKNESLNVRFQLPHTVYLYQKPVLAESEVQASATYSAAKHLLQVDIKNVSGNLGRAEDVQVSGAHGAPVQLAGFPLLPGAERHMEVSWEGDTPPTNLRVRFPHFTLKPNVIEQAGAANAGTSGKNALVVQSFPQEP